MKLIFFLLVLMKNGMNPTKGLHVLYSSGHIIFNYYYPYYTRFEVGCCKFEQSECFRFVNNRGQVASRYQGRIFINNYNGNLEVIITDLSIMDAAIYVCGVRGFPETFERVEVTVSDLKYLSGVNTVPLLPISSTNPSVWPSSPPSSHQKDTDTEKLSIDGWRTSYTLAAVLSVLVSAVITVTLLVYCLKTRLKNSTGKTGTCDSSNITREQNSVIYCMVDFKPHQDPFELYANLQIRSPGDTDPSSSCAVKAEESVEYSTILRAPA